MLAGETVKDLVAELGISKITLYKWPISLQVADLPTDHLDRDGSQPVAVGSECVNIATH